MQLIDECGPGCACWPPSGCQHSTCSQRVQRRLLVKRGDKVRSLQSLPSCVGQAPPNATASAGCVSAGCIRFGSAQSGYRMCSVSPQTFDQLAQVQGLQPPCGKCRAGHSVPQRTYLAALSFVSTPESTCATMTRRHVCSSTMRAAQGMRSWCGAQMSVVKTKLCGPAAPCTLRPDVAPARRVQLLARR